jgi:hypothetical protein
MIYPTMPAQLLGRNELPAIKQRTRKHRKFGEMVSWRLPVPSRSGKAPLDLTKEDSTGSQEDKLQPSKDATVRNSRVRIDLNITKVHPHISLDELSDEEFASTWVTAEEFMASKKEYVAVVRQMMKTIGEFPDTDDCCSRGLGTIPSVCGFVSSVETSFFNPIITISLKNSKRRMAPGVASERSNEPVSRSLKNKIFSAMKESWMISSFPMCT